MSGRPKRTLKPVIRYEPEEIPVDDDYDDELIDEHEAKKKLKGEFDGYDDEDEEMMDEPDEYDVNDGFAVPDDYEEEDVELPDEEEEEDEYVDDDEEEEQEYEYDDDEDDDEERPVKESDIAVPEGVLEDQATLYYAEEAGQDSYED